MSSYNPLSWQNENALSSYPFSADLDIQDFIVDAKFVQFDNYIPVLNYVTIDFDRIQINALFDEGETNIVFFKSTYDKGEAYRSVRIYNSVGDRYFGVITFGTGVQTLWNDFIGRRLQYNIRFATESVRSVPSKDAVYTFDGYYGDVLLNRTQDDAAIFYNISEESNSITFNAVGGHSVIGIVPEGLRKINLVRPKNNNITLSANDVIKMTSLNGRSLSIDLVAGKGSKAFLLPTLTS
jgi:hypothetical protein